MDDQPMRVRTAHPAGPGQKIIPGRFGGCAGISGNEAQPVSTLKEGKKWEKIAVKRRIAGRGNARRDKRNGEYRAAEGFYGIYKMYRAGRTAKKKKTRRKIGRGEIVKIDGKEFRG